MPRRRSKEADCFSAEAEILDEQFENYLRVANSLLPKIKNTNDVDLAEKTFVKCQKMHATPSIDVKKLVQEFFQLLLKVLQWTSNNQPKIYDKWFQQQNSENSKIWLTKNKSYMAMKKMKDGATIVYIAISNDPCAGWQSEGLRNLMEECATTGK